MKNFTTNTNSKNRRQFLKDCGKMSGIGLTASALNLSLVNKVLAAESADSLPGYRGLVCVFLSGGNDSYNMLAPGNAGFSDYTSTRGQIALSQSSMFNITDEGGDDYHLNGAMSGVRDMFEGGDLSFVANIGTLVERLSIADFGQGQKPLGLYSHFDQAAQWQNSLPNVRGGTIAGTGWIGRMTEILNDSINNGATMNTNFTMSSGGLLLRSRSAPPIPVVGGANALEIYENVDRIRNVINDDLETQYGTVLQNHYNHVREQTIEQVNELARLERETTLSTSFPNTSLGQQLRQVAVYIKVHGAMAAKRQTFLVKQGGYDMHKGVTTRLSGNLKELSDALTAFNNAMKEIGCHNDVTTYTASDFGRTLSSNGTGTDHGWGGNHIVMGGAINGGQVFGDYPSVAIGSNIDLGRGRVLPTTSVDELSASLAYWFGVDNDGMMETVLPNIRNFKGRTNSNVPLDRFLGVFPRESLLNRRG